MKKIFVSPIRTNISLKPYLRHERSSLFCNTSARHERHECSTSTTRGKNFDFDNGTSENIFPHPYISYKANEKLQVEQKFHSKNYHL